MKSIASNGIVFVAEVRRFQGSTLCTLFLVTVCIVDSLHHRNNKLKVVRVKLISRQSEMFIKKNASNKRDKSIHSILF